MRPNPQRVDRLPDRSCHIGPKSDLKMRSLSYTRFVFGVSGSSSRTVGAFRNNPSVCNGGIKGERALSGPPYSRNFYFGSEVRSAYISISI
jgi:hypothetical protein